MTYQEAVDYIHSRPRMKSEDNHKAMRRLLQCLQNPQNKLKYIHIAGTNGKGSCAVMSANVLKHAGYKVGLNISPFVIEFTERFSINGEYIPKEILAKITGEIKYYQENVIEKEGLTLLEFEIVTAIAFYYFAQEKCDIVCLEVGIGGLLDSTNVIKDCLISCIMNISYDHTNILGNSLSEIAYQKAGIIKSNRPVICYPAQDESAKIVIKNEAKAKNSRFIMPSIEKIKNNHIGFMKSLLEYDGLKINQSFTGIHQSYNTVVVIEAMRELREQGYKITDEDIISGIENTKFPARIEVISKNPIIILDGGHNVDGVTALINVLKENNIYNLTAIWASLSDKEPKKIIEIIRPYISTLYTVPLSGPRALTSQQLADIAKDDFIKVIESESVEKAIDEAMKNIDGGLLVFGSLYLASDARNYLRTIKKI